MKPESLSLRLDESIPSSEGKKKMSASAAPAPAIEIAVASLVSAEHWADSSFVRLPLVYPGGSLVTVKIDPLGANRYRVSDAGFGFREIEEIGAQRSYARVAGSVSVSGMRLTR